MPTNTPARPGSGKGYIKGAAFAEFVAWFERKVGPERFGDIMSRMPIWLKQELDIALPALGISPRFWYTDRTVHGLIDLLTAGSSAGQLHALALQGSAHVMDVTLGGPFRVLFGVMATPELYARFGQRLWSSYYDSGDFAIETSADGKAATATIRDWQSHHPFMCELNRGASIAIYRAMKREEVTCIRHACVSQGADECRFVSRWR